MANLYLTLQGKGGVGKSYVTAAFAQWAMDRGQAVACIDTDTLNPTLAQYRGLNALHVKLSHEHVLDPRALDALMDAITNAPDDGWVIVDVGSNGYETLLAYALDNDWFTILADLGHRVTINTVIAGGADAEETLAGVARLIGVTAASGAPVLVWLNEHLGPLTVGDRPVLESAVLVDAGARILGTVVLPARTPATFGRDVEAMLRARQTFGEAIERSQLMPRHRLARVRDDIYRQLDAIGLLDLAETAAA